MICVHIYGKYYDEEEGFWTLIFYIRMEVDVGGKIWIFVKKQKSSSSFSVSTSFNGYVRWKWF